MVKNFLVILWLFSTYCSIAQNKTTGFSLSMPDIPAMINTDTERQKYLISHFWDHGNFDNKNVLSYKEDFQQYFQQYVWLFSSYPKRRDYTFMINTALLQLKNTDTATIRYVTSLYETYFYNPLSNYRDDDVYIPVLQWLVASPKFTAIEKKKWKYQLNMAVKNRIGSIATMFDFQLPNGNTQSLVAIPSDYTLLYFYNPQCHQCQTLRQMMETSEIILTAIRNRQLTIVAIYTDNDDQAWQKDIKPHAGWVYGYDALQTIRTKSLYDLKAIPTLYLLDRTKRVLLKDTEVQKIEAYIKE